jgi:hypothetical protein
VTRNNVHKDWGGGGWFNCSTVLPIGAVALLILLLPFRSQRQRRFLFAKHPRIARRWAQHTKNIKRLPERRRRKR